MSPYVFICSNVFLWSLIVSCGFLCLHVFSYCVLCPLSFIMLSSLFLCFPTFPYASLCLFMFTLFLCVLMCSYALICVHMFSYGFLCLPMFSCESADAITQGMLKSCGPCFGTEIWHQKLGDKTVPQTVCGTVLSPRFGCHFSVPKKGPRLDKIYEHLVLSTAQNACGPDAKYFYACHFSRPPSRHNNGCELSSQAKPGPKQGRMEMCPLVTPGHPQTEKNKYQK